MTGEPFRISTLAGWADMDANAHMGNFAYLNKCVDARMGFFKQHGLPVAEFARRHLGPVVRRDELEYHREIGLHEPITRHPRARGPRAGRVALPFRERDPEGRRPARGPDPQRGRLDGSRLHAS